MSNAIIICGSEHNDAYFHDALEAGFEIVGTFQQNTSWGPRPTLWVTLRKKVKGTGGVCDTRRGDRPNKEWFLP